MTHNPHQSQRDDRPVASTGQEAAPSNGMESLEQGGGVLDIISNVQKELDRIREFQRTHEEQSRELAQRTASLDTARRELDGAMAELSRREQALADQARTLTAREQALHEDARQLEQHKQTQETQLQQAAAAMEQERTALEVSRREADQAQAKVHEALRQAEQAQVQADRAAAEAASTQTALEQMETELEARRGQIERQAAEAQALRDQAQRERTALEAQQEETQQEMSRLREQCQTIRQQAEQSELQTTSMRAELEKTRAQAADATAQAARVDALEQSLAAATSARDEVQAQVQAAREQIAAMEERLAKAQAGQAPLQEMRQKLEQAGAKLAELAAVSSRQAQELEKLPLVLAEAQEHRRQVQELKQQLAAAEAATESAKDSSGDQEALAQARAEAEEAARILEQRVQELERELAQARAEAGAKTASADETSQKDLREKALLLKAAARHLQLRKRRLVRMHAALRERRRSAPVADGSAPTPATKSAASAFAHEEYEQLARQKADLERQRQDVKQVQVVLAGTEADMIRRWAKPRAVLVVAAVVLHAALVAVVSWFAADHFFPARIAATVTMEATARPGQSLGDEELSHWQQWHAEVVKEPAFQATLAKRLDARQLEQYRDPKALAQRMDADFKVDDAHPGQVTYSLAGTDAGETMLVLDTLTSTVLSESNRQMGKRGDVAKATVPGERKESGQVRYASLTPMPLVDQRLWYAGMIFLAAFVASLVLAAVIYARLLRSKRLFEQQTAATGEEGPRAIAIR